MHRRNKTLKWALNQFINRSLQGISYRLDAGFAKPTGITMCLTLRCNIKCRQCAIWRLPEKRELPAEVWKKVIYDLRKWIGPYRVRLVGGEIFIRKDIIEIIEYATKNDVITGIVSNGTLITESLAENIVNSGLGYLYISMDGINPETHDRIRGIESTYKKAMSSIDYLLKASNQSGMTLCIATVICKSNMHELIDLVKFVERKGLDGIIFNPLGPTVDSNPDWYKKTDLWFDDLNEINEILDKLIEMKKAGAKILNPPHHLKEMKAYFARPYLLWNDGCMVGVTNLSIACDGDINTCFKMPPLGNVQNTSPKQAWNSKTAKEIRRKIKNCDVHCSPGNFVYRRSLFDDIIRFIKYG